MERNRYIDETKKWLEDVIINLNLCPFANEPFQLNKIELITTSTKTIENELNKSLLKLEKEVFITSLLIFEDAPGFIELLDIIDFLNSSYNNQAKYQLVAFHPKFCFEAHEQEDIANYVNRSPFPIIHILRSKDLDIIDDIEKAKNISLINEKKLKSLPQESLDKYFYYLKNPHK